MADGVSITAGAGTTVATDDTASGHAQVMKLAISANGDATFIPADAANGLDVDVTREPASAADGAGSLPAVLKVVGGWDGSNVQALATDASGNLQVEFASAQTVQAIPATTGGLTISRLISAATTNATNVKDAAGQVYGGYVFNLNAAVRYLKLYNKATAPTVGTDTPVVTIPIPATSGAALSWLAGIAFATGIGFALTTGVADADTGAVAANELIVNLFYK